jgi:hypothetical protein
LDISNVLKENDFSKIKLASPSKTEGISTSTFSILAEFPL